MEANKIICGDALIELQKMPVESVDMCMTSPPYWGLRDYGIEQIFGGNGDCEHEWGLHQTGRVTGGGDRPPQSKWKAVAPDGNFDSQQIRSVCLKCNAWKGQLGLEPTPEMYIEHLTDIFNEVKRVLKKEGTLWIVIGDTYSGSGGAGGDYNKGGLREGQPRYKQGETKLQSKCLVMVPERLAGALIQDGWILRNKIIWVKPNCMPSSAKDRFTNKYEFIYFLSKNRKNFFDMEASLEPYTEPLDRWGGDDLEAKGQSTWSPGTGQPLYRNRSLRPNPQGKHPTDVWIIPTKPCPVKGIHFAVFPEELCRKAITAGCPKDGMVLDPFCGIGTACIVAKKMGRNYTGIDIKAKFVEVAKERIGRWLF